MNSTKLYKYYFPRQNLYAIFDSFISTYAVNLQLPSQVNDVLVPYLLLALQLCPVPRGYLRFQSGAHGAHICNGGHRQPRPRLRFSPTHKVPTLFQISGPV